MIECAIVDAHHHLCDFTMSYPWLEGPAEPFRYHGDDRPLRRDYLPADYRADIGNLPVVASVHVENGAADPRWESTWIDSLCRGAAHAAQSVAGPVLPTVQVAKVDLASPNAAADLDHHASLSSVRGVRDILNHHPDPLITHRDRADLITDPVWLANFDRLAGLGLSFDLQLYPHQLDAGADLARAHPETLIVLDHAGMPIERDATALASWERAMARLARCENVVVKVSALGTHDHDWSVRSIAPIVLGTIEAFGPTRTMFASNFPVDGLYSSYAQLYAAFDALTADFTQGERAELFGGTARRAYRIETVGPDTRWCTPAEDQAQRQIKPGPA